MGRLAESTYTGQPWRIHDTESARERANKTVHTVMHLGWLRGADGDYGLRMAVLVKPNGWFGRLYVSAMSPFRHLVVYPALTRQWERAWRERNGPAPEQAGPVSSGRRKRMLRWASGIMLALGAGHLLVFLLAYREGIVDWVDRGIWAAVPLTGQGGDPTVESLRNTATFWGGPGSFAVPLIALGCLVWHLAGRDVPVPAGVGWALVAWCLLGGVLLVPSPFFVGLVPGALIVLAARESARKRRPVGGDR